VETLTENITAGFKVKPDKTPDEVVIEQVLQRVRLLAQRRVLWLRTIWAEIISADNENNTFDYHTEVDGYLNDADTPSAEQNWSYNNEEALILTGLIDKSEVYLLNDTQSRLSRICSLFGLNQMETDILHACVAFSVDTNLGKVFAYLQDHAARGYVTENLVARLFGHGRCLLLSPESPLRVWSLITESAGGNGEPSRLECDPFIRNWILGMNNLDEALLGVAQIHKPGGPLLNWPITSAVDFIQKMLENDGESRIRLFVSGPEGSGRRTFAAIISRYAGMDLLTFNSDMVADNKWQYIYMRVQRQALLTNCIPAWYGSNLPARQWSQNIVSSQVQFIIGETDEFLQPVQGFTDHRVEMPPIVLEERERLWLKFVPSAASWPKHKLDEVLRRQNVTVGQIIAIGNQKIANSDEALDVMRLDAHRRLGKLAQQMNCSFNWDDLVLPDWMKKYLEDFTYEARERAEFWENKEAQRLFPQGRSLIALFTGSSGTGKTMAAQVIAASLQLDLFRVDLSAMISKYIGESSKNIERILSRAKSMDAVLFFDEADALFGKRTDIVEAHDRFANTDTNYLLQAIEQYPGIVIMASNKKGNIDAAFTRRLRYMLDFVRPGTPQRLLLWSRILNELAGAENISVTENDLARFAEHLDITGAQIKLCILSALFMAKREQSKITTAHLLRGIERELVKEGKGLGRHIQQLFKI
jgi:hypothetical protein